MNYYNPYFYNYPNMANTVSPGLFRSLLGGTKGINWSSLLSNAQKTIGIVNQAIPMVKQVSPAIHNAKTMFKVMNEFKKQDSSPSMNRVNSTQTAKAPSTKSSVESQKENTILNEENTQEIHTSNEGGPQFFI